jgi:hypothetical protein
MKLSNFLKGPVSSVLGVLIMIGSGVSMGYALVPVIWEGCVMFSLGFILLFMKDKLPTWIERVFEKKIKE